MIAHTKAAAAVFGGVIGAVLAVGIGGVSASPTATAPAPAAHSTTVAPTRTEATGAGVHLATLAGCISGLDC